MVFHLKKLGSVSTQVGLLIASQKLIKSSAEVTWEVSCSMGESISWKRKFSSKSDTSFIS